MRSPGLSSSSSVAKMKTLAMEVPPEVNEKETNNVIFTGSTRPGRLDGIAKGDTGVSSSVDSDGSLDEINCSSENDKNQLVVYNILTNGAEDIVHAPEPLNSMPPTFSRKDHSKVIPVVGAYTVQCAACFKWRLIPTKEKYEEIRENIVEKPFYCETASEWRSGVSCDDPGDIHQDNSKLWAIDKPSIARPPPGWQRVLRLRGEGSFRFADVHYEAPSGKRFRSLIEIQKYLTEIPELAAGISMSQFSFLIPKPLQEDYVKKRVKSSTDDACPIDWVSTSGHLVDMHNDQLESAPSSFEAPVCNSADQPAKKRAKKSSTKDSALHFVS